MKRLALSSAVISMLACLPAPAGAATAPPPKYFRVTFEATQTHTWSQNRRSTECNSDLLIRGSGTESLKLRTTKSYPAVALRSRFIPFPVLVFSRLQKYLPVAGTYRRDGSVTVSGTGTGCGDGGGPSIPRDCGQRTLSGARVEVDYLRPRDWPDDPAPLIPSLRVQGPSTSSSSGTLFAPFRNCPGGQGGRLIDAAGGLTVSRLLGTAPATFTVTGRGRESQSRDGMTTNTTLVWKMTFTRLTRKPPGLEPPPPPSGPCFDRRDNDGDGRVDFADPDCQQSQGRSESG